MSTDLVQRPHVPLRVITPADVRASIRRARRSLERAAEEIVWQVEMEAWRTLGYSSWGAMRDAEYGGAAFMVPAKNRPELVSRMRAKGLTQQEIADTAGVSSSQVNRDLKSHMGNDAEPITNSRGQQRPASYSRTEPGDDEEIVEAEIVEDDDTQKATDPAPAEPVVTATCPTCGGTGKVTR